MEVILTNNKHLIMDTKLVAHTISDHELIIATLNLKKPRAKPIYITTRSFKNYDQVAFLKDISNAPWSVTGTFDNVEDKLNAFNILFNQVLDQHAPVKTVKVRTRPCPFINDNIRALMRTRDHWQKLARRTNDPALWSGYKNFRNEVKQELRLALKTFVEDQISQNANDTNTMWKTIRSCIPKKSASARICCKDDKTMANEFNQFFTSVGKTTLDKIQSLADDYGHIPSYISFVPIQYPLSEQFTFRNVECCEIERVVKSRASNKAPGTDKIPPRVLKESAPAIIPSITSIMNSSFNSVVFPSVWKMAEVCPIPKEGDTEEASNNRAISLLPILLKVCEKVALDQLTSYLTEKQRLAFDESGNKKLYSTQSLLVSSTDAILRAIDQTKVTAVVYLDMNKAFDSIRHEMLLDKLKNIGLSLSALTWFCSYLSQRSQEADQLSQSMSQLFIEEETSLYLPEDTGSCGETSSAEDQRTQGAQRTKLNEFLSACNVGSTIGVYKKKWQDTSLRTRRSRVSKAKESIVAALNVIVPGNAGPLWEALKASKSVENALGIAEESQSDRKYLESLAETYNNASSWATRRQLLSVMSDLTTFEKIQAYIPSVTEFKFALARRHKKEYGRGVPLPLRKSPRMCVDSNQLDHFISFITRPHIIEDLSFGQRYLHLSSGKVLETPNVIRNMIPQRIVKQYIQYCYETNFKPFGPSTMLRILSCCSVTVRKSLQGLDYIAAEGAKGFDDLHRILDRLGEFGLRRDWVSHYQKSHKEAKHYLKAEYKAHVAESATIADHCSTYALSDSEESPFKSTCNHSHDKHCIQCETLKDVLEKVENCFLHCEVSPEELDDLTYSCRQAVDSIKRWKAHQVFVHVLENCKQDSYSIVRITEHALRTLKLEHPELTTAFLRQENAVCYHSAEMLASCTQIESKTGIVIRRVDFSDPQGGKGPYDRKTATVRAQVRRYINECHDMLNANDFLNAMLSNGGIPHVRAVIVDAYRTQRDAQLAVKWGLIVSKETVWGCVGGGNEII
ncbi:putative RNA-directed DNA polymerase from transposon BS [Stylophora pistillata]|uniref:Putative RNA-directed DNA polymerase from transposon BS n=1 Tax=Stylophora pistillata TaxID=50429 RepID=A0A2B4R5L4_STYPI|nr:putative RNA-directed DNA polymerase from transposon BS [Stylophora pistillata]